MAVGEVELPEHVRDVVLDGVGTDAEAHGDLDVRAALAQLLEDVLLGGGEEVGVGRAATPTSRHGVSLEGRGAIFPTRLRSERLERAESLLRELASS